MVLQNSFTRKNLQLFSIICYKVVIMNASLQTTKEVDVIKKKFNILRNFSKEFLLIYTFLKFLGKKNSLVSMSIN